MSVVRMAGFDRQELMAAVMRPASLIPILVAPRAGALGQAVRLSDSVAAFELRDPVTRPATAAWVHSGLWMRVVQGGTISGVLQVGTPANSVSSGGFGLSTGGMITALRTGITVAATGTVNVADGNWHHIQFSAFTHNTSGRMKIWVDGVLDIDFTGQVATSAANQGTQYMVLGLGTGSRTVDVDDWWFDTDNNEWFAAKVLSVATLGPNGAGAAADWTPTPAGQPNWQVVRDSVDDTYVSSQTAGARDLYTFADLPAGVTSVEAVSVYTRGQQVGAGTPFVRPLHRHTNGTITAGTNIAQGASMGSNLPQTWSVNPATGLPWTVADVDGAQFGIELS